MENYGFKINYYYK